MRLPRPLARRLDRLARGAHAFHRFAHHPLCDEYRREVVRLGRRTRICRGCLMVLSGALSGLAVGLLLRPPPEICLAVAIPLVAVALAVPKGRMPLPFWTRRFAPLALLGAAAASGAMSASPLGWFAAAASAGGVAIGSIVYRRRGPDRTPCLTCPERAVPVPCRGVLPIVRRERAFQRRAARILARAGL